MRTDLIPDAETAWTIVNDTVMGGISESRISRSEDGTWIFAGHLSLENNGGFASTRTVMRNRDLSDYSGIALRVRGDGRPYRLRLRTNDRFDGVAYQTSFETVEDAWIEVRLPFADFTSTFRGRRVRDAGPLDTTNVCQLGVMIADKRQDDFKLEIDWIRGLD